MKLRHKFGLLALLYATMLAANFAMCTWCLLLYYHSFLEERAGESIQATAQPAVLMADQALPHHEGYVLQVLGINALCGLAVGLLGMRWVREWVSRPISSLRDAAAAIGSGNLAYRVKVPGGDELAELGKEVNAMAGSIVSMQGELVQHERRQVAGQALRCVVHNIRSPLTGIRWLAEAIGMRPDLDPATAKAQGRIVEVVDSVLSWLQGFRDALAAVSMQVREVDLANLIASVMADCITSAEQKQLGIDRYGPTEPTRVRVEPNQFSAALQVLLQEALARARPGARIQITSGRPDQSPGYWQVVLEGSASSDPAGRCDESQMNGDAMAMAERVVRLHGGRLQCEDSPARGCRCVITMPG